MSEFYSFDERIAVRWFALIEMLKPREVWKPIKPSTPRGKRRARRRAQLGNRYKASWFSTVGDKTGKPDHVE